jgi:diamine N-acetyltransferase
MAEVELTAIATDDDRAAVLGLRRGPGQERFVASVEDSFQDALDDPRACPRMWAVKDAASEEVVGFAMISDGIPDEVLAAADDLVGPYYLWRLLIDERRQGKGYGTATLDAIIDYVRTRPDADILWTSCSQEPDGPRPFYLGYGFRDTGTIFDEEHLLRYDLDTEDR